MENPRFVRAARRRRYTAFTLAVLFHLLLLAGLAYVSAGNGLFAAEPEPIEAPRP